MDKPLPERIRPLEGAGMINLYGNMGCRPRRWRRAAPICAVFAGVVGGLLAVAWVVMP